MTPEQLAAMEQALEALNLARAAHGQMLPSDPPQEAWKAWKVGSVTRSAMEALRAAIEQAKQSQWGASAVTKPEYVAAQKEKTQQALDKMAENERELGIQMQPEPVAWIEHNTGRNYDEDQLNWQQCEVTDTPLYTHPAPAAPVQELERLRDENERLHVENRRLIDRIETMGVPVGVGGFLTTTNAAQRQSARSAWVGLTDDEIVKVLGAVRESISGNVFLAFARAIEAKLKEKNHG